MKHIFRPFFRASNASAVSGKGVGLALSKSILERFGASITISSHIQEGTILKVGF
ncbi:MAG: sensor histidine kinase [Bacteroidales bacterium]|nr:sensor histidine kinase [Bacteroidales bacterium]